LSHAEPVPPPLDALLEHRAWVRALARRLVADADSADEIEQRTWLAAVERPPRDVRSPRGWLATALRNAARKLGRANTRRAHHEAAAATPDAPRTPADLVAETELQQLVTKLVLELEEPYRETVLLRYVEPSNRRRSHGARGFRRRPCERVCTGRSRSFARGSTATTVAGVRIGRPRSSSGSTTGPRVPPVLRSPRPLQEGSPWRD
jgi:sigma-70-like protein